LDERKRGREGLLRGKSESRAAGLVGTGRFGAKTEYIVQLWLKSIVWVGLIIVSYAYVLYPIAVWALARLRPKSPCANAATEAAPAFSVVVAVHDEGPRITSRLDEIVALIATSRGAAEVIVVANGCRDDTAALARAHPSPLVRLIELTENAGKAHALTSGWEAARGDLLVFADARQRWAADSLQRLLENFANPEVGAVSGELVIEAASGVLAGVGLYWRYEKWLRRNEGRLHSMVGVSGSICAVRRELFRPIPRGVLLDDLFWPLQVAMQGRRVVYDERALAYDRLPDRPADEFRRKVRTLSGNFQLVAMLPQALLPWRNPIWVQFVSHKLLRLVIPWLLLGVFFASGGLLYTDDLRAASLALYGTVFLAQLLFYVLAASALAGGPGSVWRLGKVAASFVVVNAAAWLAFWVWICGRSDVAWKKVAYDAPLHLD
jgi:cellulose synthase/poly-beta-1,6-N-acetylglucosamine synthase-like glycosyltransferase